MMTWCKRNEDGTLTILERARVNGVIVKPSDSRFVAYAEANGFTQMEVADESLPTADEIDDMSRGEKDEVLKKLVSRI